MFELIVSAGNNYYTRIYENVSDAIGEALNARKYYEQGGFKFRSSENEKEYFDETATMQVWKDIYVKVNIRIEHCIQESLHTETEFPWEKT